jgi:hypothetical protein
MADIYFRKKLITLKPESTYGTDPTPAAAQAIQTSNLRIKPYAGPRITRDLDRQGVGTQDEVNTAPSVEITFDAELVGSGTAGTAPNIDAALQACGMDATIVAVTSVTYQPVDPQSTESCTIYFYLDGQIHKIVGCRGEWSLNFPSGGYPKYSFRFVGLFAAPVSGSIVTPVFTNAGVALPVTKVNTPTFTLDSYAGVLQNLSITGGNSVIHENDPGRNQVFISDRNMVGEIQILGTDIGTKDWIAKVRSDAGLSKVVLNLVHGTAAGNIITINAPKVQLSDIDYADANMRTGFKFSARFTPNAINDEITIAYT